MIAASQPWAPHLQVRVAIDDVPQGKPEPDVYLLAAAQLGVRAALNAGATCLFVTNGAVASERASSRRMWSLRSQRGGTPGRLRAKRQLFREAG